MRNVRKQMRWLGFALLVALGCTTSKPDLRPPKRPEAYNVPPETEARFSKPIAFPDGTLNAGLPKKKTLGENPMNSPSRFGAGSGSAMAGRPAY